MASLFNVPSNGSLADSLESQGRPAAHNTSLEISGHLADFSSAGGAASGTVLGSSGYGTSGEHSGSLLMAPPPLSKSVSCTGAPEDSYMILTPRSLLNSAALQQQTLSSAELMHRSTESPLLRCNSPGMASLHSAYTATAEEDEIAVQAVLQTLESDGQATGCFVEGVKPPERNRASPSCHRRTRRESTQCSPARIPRGIASHGDMSNAAGRHEASTGL